jgi:hypothetical protein
MMETRPAHEVDGLYSFGYICDLVVRLLGYISGGPGFESWRYIV